MLSNLYCRGSALRSSLTSASIRSQIRRTPRMPARANSTLPAGYKEDLSKGKMLRFEESLPKLPVPTLEETAKRYLRSVHPIVNAEEFAKTEAAVKDFVRPGGVGEELQKKLLAKAEKESNWLAEWWNSAAYLGYRDPVVPYVSYFYSYKDDKARRNPAKRAAAVTSAALEFKAQVDSKSLEPEYMRKAPIAMESYHWMFNACRVPEKPLDYPVKYNHEEHKYIVVIRKNQFFKVLHEVNGERLTTAELEAQFNRVYQLADAGKVPAIGALTSENRDTWTDARAAVLAASPENKKALEAIEASSFVVCLDDVAPVTLEERARQYWHGDGQNRFYDKPLQFIINDNGTAGFMGEHSMMDGTPTLRINDYICDAIKNKRISFNTSVRSHLPEPAPIRFQVDNKVHEFIDKAQTNFRNVIGEHDLRVLQYLGYGKNQIKKFKCSPDAYVQMIIQLAYFKMYGQNRPTYESAATRKFQKGRTETCRSVSEESVAFCKAMNDHNVTAKEAVELLRKACNAHVEYISAASEGKGVDRHLFGLKMLVNEEGKELPEIFKDPTFSYSGSWFLSTSQLNSEFFNGYGWSQVIDQGYGIAYMVNENTLQFNIVSKKLGCDKMQFYLTDAANEMRELFEEAEGEAAKAKL